jgi:opacity protein-like surface antigen
MNTTLKVTVLLSVVAAMALANHGLAAEAFIRPLISYVDPATDEFVVVLQGIGSFPLGNFKSKTSYGISSGVYFGSSGNHEVSIELGYVKWDFRPAVLPGVDLALYEKFMPVMANYRYHVAGTEELKNVRFYIGPSIGFSKTEIGGSLTTPGGSGSDSDSNWSLSWGGSAGFVVKLAKRVDLDIGYRYIKIRGDTYRGGVTGITVVTEDSHANVFYGGIGFRF